MLELYSWYGYDWANSVYSSVVIGMFLPIVLLGLSEAFGCPYTFLPKCGDPDYWGGNETACKDSNSEDWNGFLNASTSCIINTTMGGNVKDTYGNPDQPDADFWPVYMQTYYDSSLDQFYVRDYYFRKTEELMEDGRMECDFGDSGLQFRPLRNITSFPAQCQEDHCMALEPKGSDEPAIDPYTFHIITIENPPAGPFTFSMKSSNEHLLKSGMGEHFNKTIYDPVTDDEGVVTQDFRFDIKPEMWAAGATTVEVEITAADGTSGAASFTIISVFYNDCPYRIPFMGMKIRPMTFSTLLLVFQCLVKRFSSLPCQLSVILVRSGKFCCAISVC
jgi:hypothetical protein